MYRVYYMFNNKCVFAENIQGGEFGGTKRRRRRTAGFLRVG
jgi:hypothetical protein